MVRKGEELHSEVRGRRVGSGRWSSVLHGAWTSHTGVSAVHTHSRVGALTRGKNIKKWGRSYVPTL